jgi:hypothetical protein
METGLKSADGLPAAQSLNEGSESENSATSSSVYAPSKELESDDESIVKISNGQPIPTQISNMQLSESPQLSNTPLNSYQARTQSEPRRISKKAFSDEQMRLETSSSSEDQFRANQKTYFQEDISDSESLHNVTSSDSEGKKVHER